MMPACLLLQPADRPDPVVSKAFADSTNVDCYRMARRLIGEEQHNRESPGAHLEALGALVDGRPVWQPSC
jgi:hypothetical protein